MSREQLHNYIDVKLAAVGHISGFGENSILEVMGPILRNLYASDQGQGLEFCPADARVQSFLQSYLADVCGKAVPMLPRSTVVLDRPLMARTVSLPRFGDTFVSSQLSSYRLRQGVLHNPRNDRRTTKGVFHIAEGGLAIPWDKIAVPKSAFARLVHLAFRPPAEDMVLPFTIDDDEPAHVMLSLLIRPLVCPAAGASPEKRMEVRFFAPGSLVSNLDFVEGIFGNGGDPYLPENDAALDVEHWTGHTGCIVLAPHLIGVKKKEIGLPHVSDASDRQKRDGMCWTNEDELYNSGQAFKVTGRDRSGVIFTIIADNYYGYCKKEVKTHISYAANLFGACEEEHAGGAIAYPAYVLGQEYDGSHRVDRLPHRTFSDVVARLGEAIEVQAEGHAVDRLHPSIVYVPEHAHFSSRDGCVRWQSEGGERRIGLRAGEVYVLPSGYRIRLEKQQQATHWRLIGIRPDGTLCHKPCTVSGGGKSEISKSISSVILKGPVFVREYHSDMERVQELLDRDYSTAFRVPIDPARAARPLLSPERSLGSVIKMLSPSSDYTDEYNEWVRKVPQTIRQLVFTVKRYYRPEWGAAWKDHFTVDRINGYLGHELKFNNEKLLGNYLRVGFDPDGAWRIYKLRPDFNPADKVQVEDDITASVVVPQEAVPYRTSALNAGSLKIVENCELLLFQRPDDAIHRGVDKQAEADIASPDTFISNFEPLSLDAAGDIVEHVVEFDKYTDPMKKLLDEFVHSKHLGWVVSSAHPRLVDGKPSKNPRYLQKRPDIVHGRDTYAAQVSERLYREIDSSVPVRNVVHAVLAGRRGNAAEPAIGLPPLAVYAPIHFQEPPELFMDFIASLTGKSPSTTGFGSEGALTKRPFNALPPVIDVNNAVVAAILTGYGGFTTAASFVGPTVRVDHDVSMLVPEIWCRMSESERQAPYLIENGFLEAVSEFVHKGQLIPASRLGYRITTKFVERFFGRIFDAPNSVFPEELLRPEQQDINQFAEGVLAIVDTQKTVAEEYFKDGSLEAAIPPVRAILHIMAEGSWQGHGAQDPEVRALFDRQAMLKSEWYQERLRIKQQRDGALLERHAATLDAFLSTHENPSLLAKMHLSTRRRYVTQELARVRSTGYLDELVGTLGADPMAGL